MLGRMIKEYINTNGLKQKRVAEAAGMTPQALNDILNERRKVEALEYFRICRALNVEFDYFADKALTAQQQAVAI